jgi:hypothetical protein
MRPSSTFGFHSVWITKRMIVGGGALEGGGVRGPFSPINVTMILTGTVEHYPLHVHGWTGHVKPRGRELTGTCFISFLCSRPQAQSSVYLSPYLSIYPSHIHVHIAAWLLLLLLLLLLMMMMMMMMTTAANDVIEACLPCAPSIIVVAPQVVEEGDRW